jgi:hypothetical protein
VGPRPETRDGRWAESSRRRTAGGQGVAALRVDGELSKEAELAAGLLSYSQGVGLRKGRWGVPLPLAEPDVGVEVAVGLEGAFSAASMLWKEASYRLMTR